MPIISLQISDELLNRFENVRKKNQMSSKSEALRYAITNFIETLEDLDSGDMQAYQIINISLVYPFKDVILDQLSEIYSQFHPIIKTISDWRIAEKKIEIILAVGEMGLIKDLIIKVSKIKELTCSVREIVID